MYKDGIPQRVVWSEVLEALVAWATLAGMGMILLYALIGMEAVHGW